MSPLGVAGEDAADIRCPTRSRGRDIPARSVPSPFQLSLLMMGSGDTLWHILDLLRSHKTTYPKVELSWDPDVRRCTCDLPICLTRSRNPINLQRRSTSPTYPSTSRIPYTNDSSSSLSPPSPHQVRRSPTTIKFSSRQINF